VLRSLDANLKKELLGERLLITPAHYAYLKISDGCDNPCSFCAIPLMRGKYRSRPVQEVVKEAKGLAKKGVKEIIVVAQDTTYYGLDLYGERQLVKLIGELNGIDGIEWIRLMYTYPSKFPTGIIEAYYRYRKLCRYIDIPVQHYADGVLKSMQRGITKRATKQLLERLKREIPGLAIRTTLIVGYPTETEDDFKELCDFVEEMRFHRLGVFTYSREEGTDAFSLEDPIPAEIKLERQDAIMQLQRKISRERNESLIGKDITVLIDTEEDNCYKGRTEWDAPEIDQEVVVRNPRKLKPGEFHTVTVTGALEYDLLADV
jgi:ribosomal protein S12 methylthiotransferase